MLGKRKMFRRVRKSEFGLHEPEGGFKPRSLYICEGSTGTTNPAHEVLLFTGFLSKKGLPEGYSYCQPFGIDECYLVNEYAYLKPIKLIYTEADMYNGGE